MTVARSSINSRPAPIRAGVRRLVKRTAEWLVRRWRTGVTYDERRFQPLSTSTGVSTIPQDRRFLSPWVQFDLVQDQYLKLFNHDQIARTEDFYLGTNHSVRVGWADSALGSSRSALMFRGTAGRGFAGGGTSTLLLASDFFGRLERGVLTNTILDGSVRYYLEQGRNWLFFTALQASKGWRLDLDNQILLGGDNGLPRLSPALPGWHGTRPVDGGAALFHRLVPVPAVPCGGCCLL